MADDSPGFTAKDFTAACKRVAMPTSQWGFNDTDSQRFLNRCCEVGLLVRADDRYVATPVLYATLNDFNPRR
jgi:hypothetical protein